MKANVARAGRVATVGIVRRLMPHIRVELELERCVWCVVTEDMRHEDEAVRRIGFDAMCPHARREPLDGFLHDGAIIADSVHHGDTVEIGRREKIADGLVCR